MNVSGTLRVPGDKSISHRALILSALANGPSRVTGILESADVHSTAGVLRSLGAAIPDLSPDFVIEGRGVESLHSPESPLDCGNSGTTTRLVAGVVAARPITATFVGDASLSRRPMRRVAEPLESMGARISLAEHGGLPMSIWGGQLHDVMWQSKVASAQVKSAVLLAALAAGVTSEVIEPYKSRDHTERMLLARGARIITHSTGVRIEQGSSLRSLDVAVPGDPSSAAFFAALAAMSDGGSIRLEHVCVNETRAGFFDLLETMGATVTEVDSRLEDGEPVADIVVSPGELRPATVAAADVPSMVDELPLLACLATRANGETTISGAKELRVKESDRIAAVVANLRALGVDAREFPDGMAIRGPSGPLAGRVTTHGDHRLAMAFGILGAASGNSIEIDDKDCVAVSYPNFWNDLASVTR